MIIPGVKELSDAFALSLKENGKRHKWMATLVTCWCLKVSYIFKMLTICMFGSSYDNPLNLTNFCIIFMIASLILKVLAWMVGLLILEIMPYMDGMA